MIDWAFPESVARTRQIWQSYSPTQSLRKTIEQVNTERLTALNVHDLANWKSNMGGTEQFYFRGYQIGSFFSVSITSADSLPRENWSRYLDIDEAIRRYSRGAHNRLINQPAEDIDFTFDGIAP